MASLALRHLWNKRYAMAPAFHCLLRCYYTTASFATSQESDYLIIRNDTFRLQSYPLSILPDKESFLANFFNDFNTGCWRGYIAYWLLDGQKLYLTNVSSCSLSKPHFLLPGFSFNLLFSTSLFDFLKPIEYVT